MSNHLEQNQSPDEQMSGVVLIGHGGLDQLVWRDDLAVPQPAHGDVLIKVGAAAVNNTDLNTRLAWYSKDDCNEDDAGWSGTPIQFPRIQGADVCGRIVAVGEGVSTSRIGERVLIEPCLQEYDGEPLETPWYFGSECDGGFAQYTRVPSRHAVKIVSDLSDVELASFPCSYSTAENMLFRSGLRSGETVLITGASGGVGSAAIQLARTRGVKVLAQSSLSKADAVLALGAEKVIDRNDNLVDMLGTSSVDVVIDLVAGPAWPTLLEVLKPKGRYAVAGAIAGHEVQLDVRTLYLKDLSFFGCTVLEPEVFGNLVKLIETQQIRPLVSEVFKLEEIHTAQKSFEQKNHTGKIVLEIS